MQQPDDEYLEIRLSVDEFGAVVDAIREFEVTPEFREVVLRHRTALTPDLHGRALVAAVEHAESISRASRLAGRAVTGVLAVSAAAAWLLLWHAPTRENVDPSFHEVPWLPGIEVAMLALGISGPVVLYAVPGIRNRRSALLGRAWALVAVMLVAVFTFFTYLLDLADPSAFGDDLLTKTDALYFTLTAMTTTGFGDIAPVAEDARRLVTVELVLAFSLVVVGLNLVLSSLRKPAGLGVRQPWRQAGSADGS